MGEKLYEIWMDNRDTEFGCSDHAVLWIYTDKKLRIGSGSDVVEIHEIPADFGADTPGIDLII